jgi:hypothetical protein
MVSRPKSQVHRCTGRVGCIVLVVLIASIEPLPAQTIRPEAAVGIAVPAGRLGEDRRPGPLARAGVVLGGPANVVRFRVDAEGSWMPGKGGSSQSSAAGSLWAASAVGTLLIGRTNGETAPYLLLGAAAQRLEVRGTPNPYGTLAGLRMGLGLRRRFGRHVAGFEITPHAVLSDYGTGRDFSIGTYWPFIVRLTF